MATEMMNTTLEEQERYEFKQTKQKVSVTPNLKKHTNETRRIWRCLKDNQFQFIGVVRELSAGFRDGNHYVMLHHFVTDQPIKELIGKREGMKWRELFSHEAGMGLLLTELEKMGLDCFLPVQAYTDAYHHDQSFEDWDWHLESPKHKIQVWCLGEELSVLVELFIDMPLAPYGLGETIDWPKLDQVTEYFQNALFDLVEGSEQDDFFSSSRGEQLEILDQVDEELLEQTKEVIHGGS